jgi:hypothetical protein
MTDENNNCDEVEDNKMVHYEDNNAPPNDHHWTDR